MKRVGLFLAGEYLVELGLDKVTQKFEQLTGELMNENKQRSGWRSS